MFKDLRDFILRGNVLELAANRPPDGCPECLSDIPVDAVRCSFCTTRLEAAAR